MSSTKNILVVALLAAVVVLGFFYYQRTKNDVTIQLPSVELKR
jgi:predicted negative regulator of RcsB-dependent stress response